MDGFDYADDLLSEIEAIERGEERFLREAADAAVRDGKEPFDFEVFRKLYWRQGIMRSGTRRTAGSGFPEGLHCL